MQDLGLDAGVRRLASDRMSGSMELALEAVNLMEAAGEMEPKEAVALANSVADAQPSMAAVRNTVALCLDGLRASRTGGTQYGAYLKTLRKDLTETRERIAKALLDVARKPVTITTLTYSTTVVDALKFLDERKRLKSVYILESRPLNEGAKTAEALAEAGIETTMVVDAMAAQMAARSDAVMFGADVIFADGGVLNKVGSYPLAMAARAESKEVWACAETIKVDRRRKSTDPVREKARDGAEVASLKGVAVDNRYFEVVPPRYITAIVTERGVYRPTNIRALTGVD
jgi:translation initiation factor eIF-2B subunit delta